ncbi:MATE family efflux transporter [Natrialbaceae archaeon AArc-T1-2]|uniref:MATE family efflux transporter n=1 Tax=Natrialbaceae archaeon AArc-T1-2 TaxID=3053904 RepID=UPI00255B26AC|nr:MATE family efflux transporter [Natrialbaceae archaeon AArc-T1-2]WIV67190.1 MATE family efflux transporter [Natrialbaceae archaeon AArc-T1-2]
MSERASHDRAVNVTDGALLKPLVVLSLPIVLTNVLQVGYNLADTFWVGRLGQPAVSALSFSWAIVFLIISLSLGFSVAGTVLVAQHKGAGNVDRVGHVAGQTISVVIGVSIVFSIVGYLLAPDLLTLVGAVPGTEEHRLAVVYTRTMFVGIPFVFGFFIFQSLLQGWGDTRTPFYLMAFGVALNVIVDPFFILGFQGNVLFAWVGLEGLETLLYDATGFAGFGVQGAALATILARGIGAAIGIWLLLSGRVGIELAPADLRPQWETVRTIVRIGAPASIEISTKALSVTILTALVAIAGAEAVAAYGIGTRVTSMVVLPALGLARGVETVVGQNLGARQVDRAKRGVLSAVGLITGCLLAFTVGVYLFAEPIVGVFITGDGAGVVTAIGGDYLRIVGVTYVFLGVFYVIQGGFRGSGSTRLAMAFAFIGFIVFRAVFAYVLAVPAGLGATGIWYGEAIANVSMVAIAGLYFLRGTWTGRVIDDADRGTDRRDVGEEGDSAVASGGLEDR